MSKTGWAGILGRAENSAPPPPPRRSRSANDQDDNVVPMRPKSMDALLNQLIDIQNRLVSAGIDVDRHMKIYNGALLELHEVRCQVDEAMKDHGGRVTFVTQFPEFEPMDHNRDA